MHHQKWSKQSEVNLPSESQPQEPGLSPSMEVSSADAVALCIGISEPCTQPSAATGTLHTTSTPNLRQGSEQKWTMGDSEAPPGYLEIARRRREARGRDAAASSGDRDAAWRESVAERVDGEPERSAARARRAPPPAAAAIDGAVSAKTLLGLLADARGCRRGPWWTWSITQAVDALPSALCR